MRNTLGFPRENIIVFGRSIGTGPASYLASKRQNIKMLILLSPYTNLKAVAKDFVGFLSIFFKDRFNNLKCMEKTKCPTIIIHGKKDEIIKCEHSDKLYNALQGNFKRLIQPPNMTHNYFKLYDDLLNPIQKFLQYVNNQLDIRQGPHSPVPESISLEILGIYKSTFVYQQELEMKKQKTKQFSSSSSIKNKSKKKAKAKSQSKKKTHSPISKSKNKKIDIFPMSNPRKPKKPTENKGDSHYQNDFPKHKMLNEFGADPFS